MVGCIRRQLQDVDKDASRLECARGNIRAEIKEASSKFTKLDREFDHAAVVPMCVSKEIADVVSMRRKRR